LDSGTNTAAHALGPHEILRIGDALNVVDLPVVHRNAAESGGQGRFQRLGDRLVALDGDHVRSGHHDLARDGVAEVDDRMDEGALFALDHVLLVRHVGHRLELGIGDVRRSDAVVALTRTADDQVGQPDEEGRDEADRGEADDNGHDGRAEERGPFGIVDRPVLRHCFEEHEDHDDLEGGSDQHADATEEMLGHDPDQRGRDQLADEHQEEDGVQEFRGILDQASQLAGAATPLVHHGLRLDPVHAHETGLGQRQHARGGEEDHDDDDEDGVLGVEADDGDQVPGPDTCVR
jgi:hypothetical protein